MTDRASLLLVANARLAEARAMLEQIPSGHDARDLEALCRAVRHTFPLFEYLAGRLDQLEEDHAPWTEGSHGPGPGADTGEPAA